ncbi:MAG: diacylglycerol kinase family lipid kinase [Candidatus Pacebacteria bacterium]|nr:diacylglycerol kinase family lipid kinase [Candidatus Paceibacterota bacterium]
MENQGLMFAVNPEAGKGKGLVYGKRIEMMFREWGVEASVVYTSREGPDSAFALGKRAALDGVHTLVGVGGDGTKNLLVNGMMLSGAPVETLPRLGFIQAGTGNNFAKNIGIPSGFEDALQVIRNGQTSSVDIGLLTAKNRKKYFLNVVSFGFDALVVEMTKKFKEKYGFLPKDLIYLLNASQKIFLGFPSYRLSLSGPGFSFETEACLLAVLNGVTYGAIFKIAPEADLSDGLFDVCLINKAGKAKALEILFRATKGKHVGLPQVRCLKTASLTVSSSDLLPCEVDGEVMPIEKEYQVSILPRALKVLIPPQLIGVQTPLVAKTKAPEFQTA